MAAVAPGLRVSHASFVKNPAVARALSKPHAVVGKITVYGVYTRTLTYTFGMDYGLKH